MRRVIFISILLGTFSLALLPAWGSTPLAPTPVSTSVPSPTDTIQDLLRQSRDLDGSDTTAAWQAAARALATARAAALPSQELECLLQAGRVQRLLNDYPATLKLVTEGLVLAGELHDESKIGEFLVLRGFVEWNQAKLPEATISMMEALRRGEALGDKSLQLGAHYGRGLVLARGANSEGAEENFDAAQHLAEELRDPRLGQVLNSEGVLALQHKDYPHARALFERAQSLLGVTTNQRTTAYVLLNLGQVATETGDQDAAARYLDSSAALCTRFDFQRGTADIAYLRAARLRRLGQLDAALKILDDTLDLARSLGNPDLLVCIYEEYIQTAEAQGDYRAVLGYTRKLAENLELVRGEKSRRETAEIQARYDAESHAREIKLLERSRDLQQANVALKDAQLSHAHLFHSALATCLLLVGFTLAALASRQRAHARLAERQLLETRAAMEIVEGEDAHKAQLLTAAARELQVSEARFRSAFEYSALGLALVARDGRWLRVNQALCKIVGYTDQELLDRDFQSITYPEDLATDLSLVDRLVAGDIDTYSLEKRYIHKGGHLVWVRLDVSMVRDSTAPQQGYFISQINDITDQRRAQEQLRAAKEDAEHANESKNAFLSRMSHELRTPLNAILGFSQLLEVADLGDRQNQSVTHIVSAGRHLLDLINEVLDIAEIEGGRFHFNGEPTRVEETMHAAVSVLGETAREAGITLQVLPAEPSDELYIQADPTRLRQVLTNLLANAIKYNRPGGSVSVSCRARYGRVRVEVVDTGRGIAPDDLDKIFAPFTRLTAAEGVQGTGLGLSVAQALTKVMGGVLTVTSELGVGSVFSLEFDLLSAEEAARVTLPDLDTLLPEFFGADPTVEDEQSPGVLYIEDNQDNLDLVRYIFTGLPGLRLRAAATGREGVESAVAQPPELILLDLDLPDMTGTEVLARLRREPPLANVPVVVVSADATARQIDTLRTLGASDYLTKPIDLRRFRQVVQQWVPAGHPVTG